MFRLFIGSGTAYRLICVYQLWKYPKIDQGIFSFSSHILWFLFLLAHIPISRFKIISGIARFHMMYFLHAKVFIACFKNCSSKWIKNMWIMFTLNTLICRYIVCTNIINTCNYKSQHCDVTLLGSIIVISIDFYFEGVICKLFTYKIYSKQISLDGL